MVEESPWVGLVSGSCVWVVLVGGCGLWAGLVGGWGLWAGLVDGWGPWIRIVSGRRIWLVCGLHTRHCECLLWWLDATSFIDEFIWSNRHI